MTRSLKFERVLEYYDQPELFIAADAVDTKHLCMALQSENEHPRYLCTAISAWKLADFLRGRIDLRSIYTNPETDQWLMAANAADLQQFAVDVIDRTQLPEEWLPEAGLFHEYIPDAEEITKESIERNRAVLHLALEQEESSDRNAVPAAILGKALEAFQRVVMHAFRKEIAQMSRNEREQLKSPAIHQLAAFASSIGSFKLHLVPQASGDLFGESELAKAFARIDRTLVPINNMEEAIRVLSPQRGHFLSAYKDLLRILIENDTRLYYNWVTPQMKKPMHRDISRSYASGVLTYLQERADLMQELKTFKGVLIHLDFPSGKWSLRDATEGTSISGHCAPGVSLAGLVLQNTVYTFECEELIQEEKVTGRELTEFVLRNYKAE